MTYKQWTNVVVYYIHTTNSTRAEINSFILH